MASICASIVLYRQAAAWSFQDHHLDPGIAGVFQAERPLQGPLLEPDGVVSRHPPAVLEAQDLLPLKIRMQVLESRRRTLGWLLETPVEPGQELPEGGPGLFPWGSPRPTGVR